jgi:hypothetical protein
MLEKQRRLRLLLFIIACVVDCGEKRLARINKSILPERSKLLWYGLRKWLSQGPRTISESGMHGAEAVAGRRERTKATCHWQQ